MLPTLEMDGFHVSAVAKTCHFRKSSAWFQRCWGCWLWAPRHQANSEKSTLHHDQCRREYTLNKDRGLELNIKSGSAYFRRLLTFSIFKKPNPSLLSSLLSSLLAFYSHLKRPNPSFLSSFLSYPLACIRTPRQISLTYQHPTPLRRWRRSSRQV